MAAGRLSVKELAAPVLIFFGVLLVALAIALPLYFVKSFEKTPMDYDLTTVSNSMRVDGSGGTDSMPAKVFNQCSESDKKFEVSDASLTRQQRVVAVEPASSSKVTLQAGQSTRVNQMKIAGETVTPSDDASQSGCMSSLLSATVDRVTTDRTTGRPAISGGGSSEVQTDPPSKAGDPAPTVTIGDRKGQQYRFPFGTEKSNKYQYFDLTTRSAHPLKYVDQSEVQGVKVYHFTQDVPETDLSQLQDANGAPLQGTTLTKPASWFGTFAGVDPKQQLPATLFYKNTRDLYVNPTTGTIVNEREHVQEYFKFSGFSDDAPASLKDFSMTNLDANFAYDQHTQEAAADESRNLSGPITLWGRWLPIVAAVLGVIALAGGIWLLLRGRRDERPVAAATTADDTETAAVPVADHHAHEVHRADPDATQHIPRVTDDGEHYRYMDHGSHEQRELHRDDDHDEWHPR